MLTNDQIAQWDRENFFHPSTHLAQFARGEAAQRIVRTGKGVFIEDRDGNRLLDAFAGLYCVNVGYGRTEIAEAIAKQAHELAYYHAYAGHGTEAAVRLAKMVLDRAPEHMSKVYFGLSGSDANETNIKLVWYYNNVLGRPGKKKIISRWRGYHGSGLMTGSLTGLELFHRKFDLPLSQVIHTQAPYYFRRPDAAMSEEEFSAHCAAELEALIEREGADTIAAFIGEPALGTGGLVPPPAGYWDAIQPILSRHDILLIADEVVTAFGRLGSMFGSDKHGMEPDIITIAKGLTSAYAPLSGSIFSKRMWEVLERGTDENGPIGHGWTYSAHPIGAAAGVGLACSSAGSMTCGKYCATFRKSPLAPRNGRSACVIAQSMSRRSASVASPPSRASASLPRYVRIISVASFFVSRAFSTIAVLKPKWVARIAAS